MNPIDESVIGIDELSTAIKEILIKELSIKRENDLVITISRDKGEIFDLKYSPTTLEDL